MKINDVTIPDTSTKDMQIKLSPYDLADIFWAMDEKQQANFFSHLGDMSDIELELQMNAVAKSKQLTDNGRRLLEIISDCINS